MPNWHPHVQGVRAELRFLTRMLDLGYADVFKPALRDYGVDYVVRTALGFKAVQVKSAQIWPGGRRTLSVKAGPKGKGRSTFEDFRECGVDVVAAYDRERDGFYVVPIADITNVSLVTLTGWPGAWEGWTEMMGGPFQPPASTVKVLEQAWLLASGGR